MKKESNGLLVVIFVLVGISLYFITKTSQPSHVCGNDLCEYSELKNYETIDDLLPTINSFFIILLEEEMNSLVKLIKERLIIKGKKTLEKEDILECIEKLKNQREENYEI